MRIAISRSGARQRRVEADLRPELLREVAHDGRAQHDVERTGHRRARTVEHVARHGFLRFRHLAHVSGAKRLPTSLGSRLPGAAPRRSLGRPDSRRYLRDPRSRATSRRVDCAWEDSGAIMVCFRLPADDTPRPRCGVQFLPRPAPLQPKRYCNRYRTLERDAGPGHAELVVVPRHRPARIRAAAARRALRFGHERALARQDRRRLARPARSVADPQGHALLHAALDANIPVVQQRVPHLRNAHERDSRSVDVVRGQGRELRGLDSHLQLVRRRHRHAHEGIGSRGAGRAAHERHPAAGARHQRRQRQRPASDPGVARHLHACSAASRTSAASTARSSA